MVPHFVATLRRRIASWRPAVGPRPDDGFNHVLQSGSPRRQTLSPRPTSPDAPSELGPTPDPTLPTFQPIEGQRWAPELPPGDGPPATDLSLKLPRRAFVASPVFHRRPQPQSPSGSSRPSPSAGFAVPLSPGGLFIDDHPEPADSDTDTPPDGSSLGPSHSSLSDLGSVPSLPSADLGAAPPRPRPKSVRFRLPAQVHVLSAPSSAEASPLPRPGHRTSSPSASAVVVVRTPTPPASGGAQPTRSPRFPPTPLSLLTPTSLVPGGCCCPACSGLPVA
eukprot:EG_transcript_9909